MEIKTYPNIGTVITVDSVGKRVISPQEQQAAVVYGRGGNGRGKLRGKRVTAGQSADRGV